MRTKLNPLYIIILFSFGLISCNPDVAEIPSESKVIPISVEIANLDGTYQRIQDTQTLNVTSSIPIGIKKEQQPHARILVETRCLSSFHNDEAIHTVEFQGEDQVAVIDILPPQAFTPTQQDNPTLRCHINLEVFIKDNLVAKVSLENISIEDTQTFTNDSWIFLDNEEEKYFYGKDLKELQLTSKMTDGEAQLLCENNFQKILFNQSNIPFAQLINDSLFNGSSISLCRLLVRDLKKRNSSLSRIFYLQNHEPQVGQHFDLSLEVNTSISLKNNAFATLLITNISQAPAYIRYTGNQSTLTLRPYYFHLYDTQFIEGSGLNMPIHWQLSIASKFDRVLSSENSDILKIESGRSLIFELIAKQDVSCFQPAQPMGGAFNSPAVSLCGPHQLFAGLLAKISNGPQLEINSFSDISSPRWKTIETNGPNVNTKLSNEPIWLPNEHSQRFCEKIPIIQYFTDMKHIHPGAALSYLKCQAI